MVECDYLASEGLCYFIEKRVVALLRFCLEYGTHVAAEACYILYDLSDLTDVLIEEFMGISRCSDKHHVTVLNPDVIDFRKTAAKTENVASVGCIGHCFKL